ncbi:hypothetical protein HK405_005435 [Cladochytrium tenue]|nr:hypothetical protein HK405_005435 [Cladochytrium tenue]
MSGMSTTLPLRLGPRTLALVVLKCAVVAAAAGLDDGDRAHDAAVRSFLQRPLVWMPPSQARAGVAAGASVFEPTAAAALTRGDVAPASVPSERDMLRLGLEILYAGARNRDRIAQLAQGNYGARASELLGHRALGSQQGAGLPDH